MKLGWLILPVFVFLLYSCNKDKGENNLIWESVLDQDVPILNNFDPIIYKDQVIQRVKQRGKIISYDKHSGDELWTWTDGNDSYGVDGYQIGTYIYGNILITGFTNLTYAINLDTGETIWEDKAETNGVAFYTGLGNKIVKYDYTPDIEYFIRIGNAETGEFETIHHWNKDDEYSIGNTLPLIFEWDGVEYVVWSQVKYGLPNGYHEYIQFLHLYNLDDGKMEWVSDTIPMQYSASGTAGLRPKFHDGQILLDNDAIYSYNVEDGSLEWWKYFGNGFTTSRLTYAEGKVFANNDDSYMVALDVHTGYEYWRSQTNSGASHIKYNAEKVYISGGINVSESKRKLQILDAKTGSTLINQHLDSDNGNLLGAYDNVIGVDPETGRVYTSDHEHLMCFDFGL